MPKISMTIEADTPKEFRSLLEGLLGSTAPAALTADGPKAIAAAPRGTAPSSASTSTLASPEPAGTGETATTAASPSDDAELDAHGHPWSEDLHASTKGKTKEGLWRMRRNAERPAPMPGYPNDDDLGNLVGDATKASVGSTSTANAGESSTQNADAAGESAGADDDDEFAAFRTAAAKSDAADAAAAENLPPRKWTDADLGALCNQAASKLADPGPIKELIAQFVKEGEVPHSRNIDASEREAFAQAVELKAGIEFAG